MCSQSLVRYPGGMILLGREKKFAKGATPRGNRGHPGRAASHSLQGKEGGGVHRLFGDIRCVC